MSKKDKSRDKNRTAKAQSRKHGRKSGKKSGKGRKLTGILEKNKRGFGFLRVEDGDDIFIAGRNMNGAMDGDEVEVEVRKSRKKDSSEEAVVKHIVTRNTEEVVGRIEEDNGRSFVIPVNIHNRDDVYVPRKCLAGAENGDTVVVKITRYPEADYCAEGKVREIIARKGDPDEEMAGIIRDHGIRSHFGSKVIAEADRAERRGIMPEDMKGRKDLRDMLTVTIDGADSKDFDDAVSAEKLDSGNYYLYVHIADVANYVVPGSALDKEAYKRGNSVYLPDRVIPMLPEQLSNGICSLNPGEDRLTLTCGMEIDTEGHIVNYDIFESIIRSDERLVYGDVSDLLEKDDPELKSRYIRIYPMLLVMRDLAQILHSRRMRDGSIDFETAESKIVVDENGEPVWIGREERRVANRMIEEFMLAANRTVAEHYFWLNAPMLYRVHDKPDLMKMQELRDFLAGFGIDLTGRTDSVKPKELSNVLRRIEGTPSENIISRVMLRTMQKADYRPECRGHYGLAFRYYCHFTSPIRRYPDLIVHRSIKYQIHDSKFLKHCGEFREFIDKAAVHLSETERTAMELEREIEKIDKVRFMAGKVGERSSGIISGVTATGIFVELPNTVEGFIRYDTLPDFFELDEKAYKAVGRDTGKTYSLGDEVEIEVADVDEEARFIDFRLTEKSLPHVAPDREDVRQ
jgi:ribonuclease R